MLEVTMAYDKKRRPVQLFVPGRLVFRVKCPKAPASEEERVAWENDVWQKLLNVVDSSLPALAGNAHLVKGSGTLIPGEFDHHKIWNRLQQTKPLGVISCGDLLDSDPPISPEQREHYEDAFVTVQIPPADHDEVGKMLKNDHFAALFEILYNALEDFKTANPLPTYFSQEENKASVWPETVTPDWYAPGGQYPTVGGGPGTLPVLQGKGVQQYTFPDLVGCPETSPDAKIKEVHVFILDTVPTDGFFKGQTQTLYGGQSPITPADTTDYDTTAPLLREGDMLDKMHDVKGGAPTLISHGLFVLDIISKCTGSPQLICIDES
jgi:hypothetical protein